MDEVFRQSVLITYYSRLMEDRESGRPRSLHQHVMSFGDAAARRVVLEEARPTGADDRRVGPYRLLDRLGRGGDSDVWLAVEEESCELAAVKLPGEGADADACRAAYEREHAVSSAFEADGLRRVRGTLECDGAPALVMEYVDGRTLRHVLDDLDGHSQGPLTLDGTPRDAEPLGALIRFFEDCCAAVERAHAAGYVHGDIKPANIIVTPGGAPVLLDFGASVAIEGAAAGELDHGTLPYMAPERLDPSLGEVDRRVDVYGLAATMFEAVTLRRPHTGPLADSLAQAIVSEPPAIASDVTPAVPRSLARVLDRALATRPEERTPSCRAFGVALARERARISRRPLALRARVAAAVVALIAVLLLAVDGLRERLPESESSPTVVEVDVNALIDEGFLALDDLAPEAAIATFERALAARPDCAEAVAGIAWAHVHLRDPSSAAAVVERHAARFGRSKGLEMLRIVAEAEALGLTPPTAADPAEAWKELELSDDPVALFIMARNLLVARGRVDRDAARRAVHLFDRAILLSRADRMALYRGRAVAAGLAGDVEDAETAAAAISQRWPESCVAWYYAGLALEIVDRERAESAYRRAVGLDGDYGRARVGLGWLLARDGRRDEGVEHLRTATRVAPDLAIGHVRLGYVHYESGRADEAHACVRTAIELGHDSPETRFNYGANQVWAGRVDAGIDVARTLLAARPGDVGLTVNLGACLVLAHRHDRAIAALDAVADTADAGALYALGIALEESGRFEQAAGHYRRALMSLEADEAEGASPRAERVDASRPRPRYPEFTAGDVATQLAWCESRRRRLEELAGGGCPVDASEAIAAVLFRTWNEAAGAGLDELAVIIRAAPSESLRADLLVACVERAAAASRPRREIGSWIELCLERLEDERDGLRRGSVRHDVLVARRHSDRQRAILEGPDTEARALLVELWREIDEILDDGGER